MRRVRIGVALAACVLLGGGWLIGDDTKDAKKDAKPSGRVSLPSGWKKLDLSDAQVKQVYKIQADYQVKVGSLAEQIKKLRAEQKQELESVLTAAQKARLKELKDAPPVVKPAPPVTAKPVTPPPPPAAPPTAPPPPPPPPGDKK